MTKTSIYCYEKNGGRCRNKVSPANNYICGAGHGEPRQTSSVSQGVPVAAPAIYLSKMSFSQRYDLAGGPSTAAETLSKLAGDKDRDVRRAVAGNTSTPPETLAQMVGDEDWHVRIAVAGNSSASPETLAQMARDKNQYVRQAVANNTSASLEMHISLAQEGHIPFGFTENKPIDELIKDIDLLEKYPATFGRAYLYRLIQEPTSRDKSHPKRRALIGYVYAKYAENSKADFDYKQRCKDRIKALFPNDQEMAEMIGC